MSLRYKSACDPTQSPAFSVFDLGSERIKRSGVAGTRAAEVPNTQTAERLMLVLASDAGVCLGL